MREMHSVLSPAVLIAPAVLAADNTPAVVDLAQFDAAMILLQIGAGGITFTGTNKIEFVLSHGDTAVAGEHTPVAQADVGGVTVTGSGIVRALTAAKAAADVTEISYLGTKRYLSLLADFSGTHGTGTGIAATVLRGFPLSAPVA